MASTIGDYLPLYPDINSKTFQTDLYRKKEFSDLKLRESEDNPTNQGELYNHQQIIKRFISPVSAYSELLLVHEVGTGKTCSALAVAENFKNLKDRARALVLVKGDILTRNFKQELTEVCTQGQYVSHLDVWSTKAIQKLATSKNITLQTGLSKKQMIDILKSKGITLDTDVSLQEYNKQIDKTYEMNTYGKFLKSLENLSEKIIEEKYSNRIIIIDEVHHFRIQQSKKKDEELCFLLPCYKVIKRDLA